jgi:hypothetical protein
MQSSSRYLSRRALLLPALSAPFGCNLRRRRSFRRLFDGKTLAGWRAIPRVPVAAYPGAPEPDHDSPAYRAALSSKGRWTVENGAILGGQDPPGSRLGGYLITEATFGDFEMTIDVNPDWSTDSGIMIRATSLGGQGFQVHMDYRMLGSVATFYGNGIGNWRARHYAFNPTRDDAGRVAGLHREAQRLLVLAFALQHLGGIRAVHQIPQIARTHLALLRDLVLRARKKAHRAVARAISEEPGRQPDAPGGARVLRHHGNDAAVADLDSVHALLGQERDARFGAHDVQLALVRINGGVFGIAIGGPRLGITYKTKPNPQARAQRR